MAKTETPAEVSEPSQPLGAAQRVRSESAPRVEPRAADRHVAAGHVAAGRVAAGRVAAGRVAAGRVAASRAASSHVAEQNVVERHALDPNATDLKAVAAARRSLLEGAADTLVGRHHDLDAMEALDRLLEGELLEGDPEAVVPRGYDHGEPGRIFRPHAGHYARSEDARSEDARSEDARSEDDRSDNAWSRNARSNDTSDHDTSDHDTPEHGGSADAARYDAARYDAAFHDDGARHDRASFGSRRDDIEADLLDDEDVIDDAVQAAQSESPAFGLPRVGAVSVAVSAARGAPKVPLATLEQPSSSRLELTPSPVPRVSLTPATGAVDISLVPGPNGSRNMPTLAAQHVLGRRHQRRPAAAVTLPPPTNTTTAREPGVGIDIAHDVRSSKREIVWGLMIGLGLSLVLAGVGQTYLRDPMIADGMTPPTELESITLSARPEAPPHASATEPMLGAPAGSAGEESADLPGANPGTPGGAAASPASPGRTSAAEGPGKAPATSAPASRQAAPFAVAVNESGDPSSFADARVRAHRTPERATRAPARARRAAPLPTEPRSFEQERLPVAGKSSDARSTESGGKAFESSAAPAPRTPLSPAESAGLGLDLSL